jgi:FkbM family methyltransferase
MIVKTLKETLNGGFDGLYGEVVTEDCYRLRRLSFDPDIIFDLGANVGVFARYARTLFPRAKIISVEPDAENCEHFRKFTTDGNTILIEAAIGKGEIYHFREVRNGAMAVYLSEGLGYSPAAMKELTEEGHVEKIRMDTILPWNLIAGYYRSSMRSVMKIDIEGAENAIFEDSASIDCLKLMDYITMELHFFAHTGKELPEVRRKTMQALSELVDTHVCEMEGPIFRATKK